MANFIKELYEPLAGYSSKLDMLEKFKIIILLSSVLTLLPLSVSAVDYQDSSQMTVAESSGTHPDNNALKVIEQNDKDAAKEDCMMVCEKWGEDCIINPRTGQKKMSSRVQTNGAALLLKNNLEYASNFDPISTSQGLHFRFQTL